MATTKYDLEERLIDFAIIISEVVEGLPATRLGNYLAGQLVRSGCSPALNYGEAQSAESRNDFVHKNESHLERTKRIAHLFENNRAKEFIRFYESICREE